MGLAVDFRRVQVGHACSGWAVQELVRRPLLRVCCPAKSILDDLEDRVQAHHVVRENGSADAVDQAAGHLGRIYSRYGDAVRTVVDGELQVDERAESLAAGEVTRG